MHKLFGLLLLIVGAALIAYGVQTHESASSPLSLAVEGTARSRSLWLYGGGLVIAGLGLAAILRRRTSP